MKSAVIIRSAFFSLLAGVSCSVLADVQASGAYVREPMPGRDMSAAFLTLTNAGDQDVQLVSATAPWASAIEIHTHIHDNGVMRMRQLQALPLTAGDSVTLQPGGLHLMLFGLTTPLPQVLPLTLCFDNQTCITTDAELRSMR
ncbi:copper chaperone PCu(A)C [Thalassolituus sp. LLYu03]|uniref:copper chaperone PCu(A)C n=1 Tax=Thalassolituus sp. LLYu03 TaxID=3421656 RepID=UPI003D28C731